MSELRWRNYPVDSIPETITGNFGDDYGGYQHRGTDVGVVTGTPVYAPAAGRSVAFLNDGSFGIGVCIEHEGTGWYSLYAHLSASYVVVGERVEAGQRLGLTGNTGMSSGPHLHWQVCSSPNFPVDISYSRDAMQVPFEEDEGVVIGEDEMSPQESRLLLLVASVVGGWSTGKVFESVEEALPSFELFEAEDQRVLIGMGVMQDVLGDLVEAVDTLASSPGAAAEQSAEALMLAAMDHLQQLPQRVR